MAELLYPVLPEDLITTHILHLLPVKSIGRFKCVSKPWRSFLSSRAFTKAHFKFHIHNPEKIIAAGSCDGSLYISTFTPESGGEGLSTKVNLPAFEPTSVEGSCHGLVLVQGSDDDNIVHLINPVTRESLKLSGIGYRAYGLGYDSANDDYKIVMLSCEEDQHWFTLVDVYSLKTKTWRSLGASSYDFHDVIPGVFVNGCLHWLSMTGVHVPNIAAFDLASERFEKVPSPRGLYEPQFWRGELLVLGGCLAMAVTSNSFKSCIHVWVMKVYGVQDSWTKLTINLPEGGRDRADLFRVLCLLGEEEIVLLKHEDHIGSKFVAYSWENGVWRDVVLAGIPDRVDIDATMMFRESFISQLHLER